LPYSFRSRAASIASLIESRRSIRTSSHMNTPQAGQHPEGFGTGNSVEQ
jgi:hypothetical protein